MANRFRVNVLELSGIDITLNTADKNNFLRHDGIFANPTSGYLTSGQASTTYATLTNLTTTGQSLYGYINSLSGVLNSSGITLQNEINTLTTNLGSTGSTIYGYTTSNSNNLSGNLTQTGILLINNLNLLSGYLTGNSIVNHAQNGYIPAISSSGLINSNIYEYRSGPIIRYGIGTQSPNITMDFVGNNNTIGSTDTGITFNILSFGNLQLTSYGAGLFTTLGYGGIQLNAVNSGLYIFTNGHGTIIDAPDTKYISNYNFEVIGSGNFSNGLYYKNNSVLTGLVAGSNTTVTNNNNGTFTINSTASGGAGSNSDGINLSGNLTQTGIILNNKINSLSGYLTGTYLTGLIAGSNITVSNNNNGTFTVNSTASGGGATGSYYPLNSNPSGYLTSVPGNSGSYIFSTPVISGISEQFVRFPTTLGNSPYVICSLNNNSGDRNIIVNTSGIVSSGFWAQYSATVDSSGYLLTTMASLSTASGLATTVIINSAPVISTWSSLIWGTGIIWTASTTTSEDKKILFMTGDTTLYVNSLYNGWAGTLKIKQSGVSSSGYNLTLGTTSKVINGGSGIVSLTRTSGAIDVIGFEYDGTDLMVGYGNNFT